MKKIIVMFWIIIGCIGFFPDIKAQQVGIANTKLVTSTESIYLKADLSFSFEGNLNDIELLTIRYYDQNSSIVREHAGEVIKIDGVYYVGFHNFDRVSIDTVFRMPEFYFYLKDVADIHKAEVEIRSKGVNNSYKFEVLNNK